MNIVLLVALFARASAANWLKMYQEAIEKYEPAVQDSGSLRSSKLLHDKRHFLNFKKKAKAARDHNKKKGKTWTAAINEFTLKTDEEFQQYLGLNNSKKEENEDFIIVKRDVDDDDIPEEVNYEDRIPPVKNQGGCGSCWAFGAITPLEYQINKDRDISQGVISLSEQQCMDCTSAGGCGGGWPTVCYNWAKFHNSHYVATGNYPYEGRSGRPCRYNEHRSAMSGFSIKGNGYPHRGSAYRDHDATLLLADKNIGVLWAVISVSGSFGSYGDGVFNADDCNNGVNHAVVIVGYGKKGDLPFFKVRNSWGSWWGDGGYIRMIRGEGYENFNMCRLTQFVSYPIVEGADDGTSDDGIGPKPALECADGNQSGYRGTVNQTSSGKGCQRWDSQSPHKHSRTPENNPNAGLDENYCRNPDGEPKAWCYTVEDKRFEMCNVSDCSLHLWCQRDDKTLGRRWGNESFEDFNEAKRKCHTEWHCTGLVKRSNESEWWFSNGAYLIYELGTTTLRKGQCKLFEPRASDDITWCKIEDSYLATKTAGSWITEDFELAKYYCASAHDCGGVLKWDGKYQLRAGTKVKKSPSGETIWVKGQCPRLPTDNDYCEYKDRYIPGYTAGGYKGFATLEEAKKGCTDFGSGCYGITYEPASKSKHYTLRRYRWTAGSPSKEISWVKGVIC